MDYMFCHCLDNNRGILLVGDKISYAIGVNNLGEKLCIGGWGSSIIEDGSEYYIGLSAVKSVIYEYEMLGGKTLLTEAIKSKLRLEDLSELKYILYYKRLSRKKICSLGKEVLKCAKLGDRISINIFNSASEKLFNMADILIRRLSMYDTKYNLCLTGSVTKFEEYIISPLWDKIYNRYDNIEAFVYNKNKQKVIY